MAFNLSATSVLLIVEDSVNNKGLQYDDLIVLGLYDQRDPNQISFVNKLFQQGFIPKSQFSFNLGIGENDSELVIGDVDIIKLANPSEIYYRPVVLNSQHNDKQRWSVDIKSISFEKQYLMTSSDFSIIGSGTSLTVAPLKAISGGFYSVECGTTLPDLTFTLTDVNKVDRNYNLPSSFYILQEDNTCIIAVQSTWIGAPLFLGDAFMRRFFQFLTAQTLLCAKLTYISLISTFSLSVSVADPSTIPELHASTQLNLNPLVLGFVSLGLIFVTLRALIK